eukprot:CAMPEP_0171849956 /NCGR_PEP_ID=MMETSP0992-20121227/20002_1 /TAXON_ID=483369 /ORGANISM="non described non described, Strain CCMP2098" /LENGTH=111 /DNA_ID=CAMNT_0012469299 /DNA_START=161 /DNA_END=496 /DNA_ORIENTATION=+
MPQPPSSSISSSSSSVSQQQPYCRTSSSALMACMRRLTEVATALAPAMPAVSNALNWLLAPSKRELKRWLADRHWFRNNWSCVVASAAMARTSAFTAVSHHSTSCTNESST